MWDKLLLIVYVVAIVSVMVFASIVTDSASNYEACVQAHHSGCK